MNKKLISLALLATLPAVANAGSANVSGFADITYTNNNDSSLFAANAEVDISNKLSDKISVRVDTDLSLAINGGANASGLTGGPADSAVLEQVFFTYSPIKEATVFGGVFNNPIGWEKEDAPDMYQINKGQIWTILDAQTALYGNNIAGVAVAGAVGPATITVAALNDLGLNDTEKNSFAAVINAAPIKDLDIEIGYVTQEKGPGALSGLASAENVWDANITYSTMGATLGLEILGAGDVVDKAMGGTINYVINPMFNVTARYDTVSYQGLAAGKADTSSYAVAGAVVIAKNLTVYAEYTNMDGSPTTTAEDKIVTLEFIASF